MAPALAHASLRSPLSWQLLPLMTDLFSGMSKKEVLHTQVAHLARLQLSRAAESRLQDSVPDGILGYVP